MALGRLSGFSGHSGALRLSTPVLLSVSLSAAESWCKTAEHLISHSQVLHEADFGDVTDTYLTHAGHPRVRRWWSRDTEHTRRA
jgi:hypothetical protein